MSNIDKSNNENLLMLFGQKIKFLRQQNGLLQREIADKLKIDTPMYSKLEGGSRKAKRQQVLLLAKLFAINEDELISIWLADSIIDLLENENNGPNSLLIAGINLYPDQSIWK